MTLLVVGITVPTVSRADDVGDLLQALGDMGHSFASFFLSFAILARYWLGHHNLVANLQRLDRRMMTINLAYLAFIAFLPFPTALLGTYSGNSLAIAGYAAVAAVVSSLEVILLRHARTAGLLRRPMSDDVYRWAWRSSLVPVVLFAASIPVAFAAGQVGYLVWALNIPAQKYADRNAPEGADEFFG
ncbi:MAG: potassium channel family protein [Actinomycetota bacterium]|jgi:uncharacterized membrane protein|nr:potassium channel family protein [Actinomycetota bacterium]